MVIDQLVSRNTSGVRTIVVNQTSGSSSDYLQLPGSAVDFSSQVCVAIQFLSKAEWRARAAPLWLESYLSNRKGFTVFA